MSAALFHADLRAAVRTRLQTLSGLPAVAWEGKDFMPTKGTPWVTETLTPVSSIVRATGLGGTIAHTVIATFTLHYPGNKGTLDIDTMTGSLLEHFRPGTGLVYGGASAIVQQSEPAPLQQEPDWLNRSVNITIVGHTAN
jgi:hypothetical protein